MNDYQITQLHARIADLESQLYAIGAGGVGRMMAEPQQEDAPLHCDVCGVECSNPWHFSTETERHKHACDACWGSMRATLLAVPNPPAPQPARQPLTDQQIMELAEPFGSFEYGDAQGHKRQAFARAIEEAHGITGGQQ